MAAILAYTFGTSPQPLSGASCRGEVQRDAEQFPDGPVRDSAREREWDEELRVAA